MRREFVLPRAGYCALCFIGVNSSCLTGMADSANTYEKPAVTYLSGMLEKMVNMYASITYHL